MEHRLRTSQEVKVQIGRTWTLTYDAIQSAVESVYNLELQEEQKTTRGATTRTTARRGVIANALLTEGQAIQAYQSRSRSPSAESAWSLYPRSPREDYRGSRYSHQPSEGSRPQYRSAEEGKHSHRNEGGSRDVRRVAGFTLKTWVQEYAYGDPPMVKDSHYCRTSRDGIPHTTRPKVPGWQSYGAPVGGGGSGTSGQNDEGEVGGTPRQSQGIE